MTGNYEIHVRDVDYESHEEFKAILRSRGIALAGQHSGVRGVQNDIYMIGLKKFLKNPDKILDKFKGD